MTVWMLGWTKQSINMWSTHVETMQNWFCIIAACIFNFGTADYLLFAWNGIWKLYSPTPLKLFGRLKVTFNVKKEKVNFDGKSVHRHINTSKLILEIYNVQLNHKLTLLLNVIYHRNLLKLLRKWRKVQNLETSQNNVFTC